jgi:Ser/Thr protein kinase RdoA (MazF antagonist)
MGISPDLNLISLFELICQHFCLGNLSHIPVKISQGLLHQVWRVITTHGQYAVKFLDQNRQDNRLLNPNQTQIIASRLQRFGVPAIVALSVENQYLFNINAQQILVFPWSEGRPRDIKILKSKHVAAVGKTLAEIHQLNFSAGDYTVPLWGCYSEKQWQALLAPMAFTELSFLQKELPQIIAWSASARQAFAVLNTHVVLSHRDLILENILWQDQSLVLIDWDYAGPINPQLERWIVACNLSGITTPQPRKKLFDAFMQGYDAIGFVSKIYSQDILLAGYRGYVLDWIALNCQRAVDIPEYRSLAIKEVLGSWQALKNTVSIPGFVSSP